MASEVIALVSAAFTIALQLNNAIEQIKYNRENHLILVHLITSSLTLLKEESRKLSRSSPSLLRSVKKLKQDLEQILERCYKPSPHRSNSVMSRMKEGIKELFGKDTIEAALRSVERQITQCLLQFGTLSAIRVERELGKHSVRTHRKLDELLRRVSVLSNRNTNNAKKRNSKTNAKPTRTDFLNPNGMDLQNGNGDEIRRGAHHPGTFQPYVSPAVPVLVPIVPIVPIVPPLSNVTIHTPQMYQNPWGIPVNVNLTY